MLPAADVDQDETDRDTPADFRVKPPDRVTQTGLTGSYFIVSPVLETKPDIIRNSAASRGKLKTSPK